MANTLHTKQNTLTTLNKVSAGGWTTGVTAASNSAVTWQAPATNGITTSTAEFSIADHVVTIRKSPEASMEVKGTLVINGVDLEERLKTIEKVLMIPERDVTMETKYPVLKKKYDEYINALSKYRTWESIKGEDNGTT